MIKQINTIFIILFFALLGISGLSQKPTTMNVKPVNNSGNDYLEVSAISNTFILVIKSHSDSNIELNKNLIIPYLKGSPIQISRSLVLQSRETIYIDLGNFFRDNSITLYALKLGEYRFKLTIY